MTRTPSRRPGVRPDGRAARTCAGRLVPVLLSVYMVCGATCEYRRLVLVYVSYTPRDSASSSSNPVHTCQDGARHTPHVCRHARSSEAV
jgi:hypothetical protein